MQLWLTITISSVDWSPTLMPVAIATMPITSSLGTLRRVYTITATTSVSAIPKGTATATTIIIATSATARMVASTALTIRNTAAQRCVGGDDREDYDDGGHLIATRFGGSGELDNLVPMSQDINRRSGEWYDLEESWAEELSRGNEVNVQIYIEYSEGSNRPSGFDVMYTVTDTETGESTPYHEYIENNHA